MLTAEIAFTATGKSSVGLDTIGPPWKPATLQSTLSACNQRRDTSVCAPDPPISLRKHMRVPSLPEIAPFIANHLQVRLLPDRASPD